MKCDEVGEGKSSKRPELLWRVLSGWGGGGGGGGGEELKLELVVSASFSELSLSDASSSTHILTAAPCLVTALLGLSNNIHAHFRFNAWLPPTGFTNTAPLRLISTCSLTTFCFHPKCALVGPQCGIHTGSPFNEEKLRRKISCYSYSTRLRHCSS